MIPELVDRSFEISWMNIDIGSLPSLLLFIFFFLFFIRLMVLFPSLFPPRYVAYVLINARTCKVRNAGNEVFNAEK